MTVEWNDSGFPDHTPMEPPLPKYPRLTNEDLAWRVKEILKASGVEMLITGGRVSAIFPDGAVAYFQQLELDTRK